MKMWTMLVAWLAAMTGSKVNAIELCDANMPYSYKGAMKMYPDLAVALEEVGSYAIATWYTEYSTNIYEIIQKCKNQTVVLVVHGLPQKNCRDGETSVTRGTKNDAQYMQWIQRLAGYITNRNAIIILEPGAVAIQASARGCALMYNYMGNLQNALDIFVKYNPNALIYLDATGSAPPEQVTEVLRELEPYGRWRGIALNTAEYRSTVDMHHLCATYTGNTKTRKSCVIDTSRNYNGAPKGNTCNAVTAGIGDRPTDMTGHSLIDYYLWLKAPGESDGECINQNIEKNSPPAGLFYAAGFKLLWNQGFFVRELQWSTIA